MEPNKIFIDNVKTESMHFKGMKVEYSFRMNSQVVFSHTLIHKDHNDVKKALEELNVNDLKVIVANRLTEKDSSKKDNDSFEFNGGEYNATTK